MELFRKFTAAAGRIPRESDETPITLPGPRYDRQRACRSRRSPLRLPPLRKARRHRARPGVMLVMALAIMAVVVLMTAASVQTICSEWRQQRQARLQLQADWLASAGLDLAAARLLGDRAYGGETWHTDGPPNQRGGRQPAAVEILVEVEDLTRCRIEATAVYPEGAQFSTYATKSMRYEFAPAGD